MAASQPMAKSDSEGTGNRFTQTILEVLSNLPSSTEPQSATPVARARKIAAAAAFKSATISGTLALPPGPLGMLTIIPDLMVIWRVQSQMVADIAAAFGKALCLTREQMIYCLFRHAASQAVRDLVVRVGERALVRRASLRVIQNTLRRVGIAVTQRVAGRAISRWLPFIGAWAWQPMPTTTLPSRFWCSRYALLCGDTGLDTDRVTTSIGSDLRHLPNSRAAECAALAARLAHDGELASVVASWSSLPEASGSAFSG